MDTTIAFSYVNMGLHSVTIIMCKMWILFNVKIIYEIYGKISSAILWFLKFAESVQINSHGVESDKDTILCR